MIIPFVLHEKSLELHKLELDRDGTWISNKKPLGMQSVQEAERWPCANKTGKNGL